MTQAKTARKLSALSLAWKRALMTDDGELSADGKVILADLRKFCRAYESTAIVSPVSKTVDPLASMLAEGRREVFHRITGFATLDGRLLMQLQHMEIDE